MPVEYDSNSIDLKLSDPRYKELGEYIKERLTYMIAQRKRTANTELMVKTITYEIIKKMYEHDAIQDGRQMSDNKEEAPF